MIEPYWLEIRDVCAIHNEIIEVYQAYAPSFVRYEGAEVQVEILRGFGQEAVAGYTISGDF